MANTARLNRRSLAGIAAVALSASLLAACGSGSSTSTAGSKGAVGGIEQPNITVSVTTVGDFAPVPYAISHGIFKKYGLNVKLSTKGQSDVASLLANSYQAGSISWTTYSAAVAQGVPVRAVADGVIGTAGTNTGIYVMPKSSITEASQLAGRTLAINQPKATFEFNSRVSLADNHVDPGKVKFQVIPLSSMVQALVGGTVDAAYLVPPFSNQAEAQGAKLLVDAYAGELAGTPIAGYVVSDAFAKKNPNTVKAFQQAVVEASEALNADPAAYRSEVPTYTSISAEAAQQLPAYTFGTSVDTAGLQKLADLLLQNKFIDKKIDVASTVVGE